MALCLACFALTRPILRALPWFLAAVGALPAQAEFATQTCHVQGMADAVQCASLPRPLNPQAAQGTQIAIHFAVLPAKAREKHADPIYFFAGGPGQSAIDVLAPMAWVLSRLNNRRDVVFIDQRGTGRSAPLVCAPDAKLSLEDALNPALLPQRMAQCRAALEKLPHGDLRYYTTTLAMQDVEAVRAALGHERINLIGVSYGTRAALEYQRLYPQRVRRMVLDGVVSPDMSLPQTMAEDAQAALQALLADCAADKACAQQHPDLAQQWEKVFQRLPETTTLAHPLTGRVETVRVTAPMVAGMVRGPLYASSLAAGLPVAIDAAAQGRWSALAGLSSALGVRSGLGIAMGMHFAVICAEDALRTAQRTAAGHFAAGMGDAYKAVCLQWPRGNVEPGFYKLAPAQSPVLLLSGGVDPVTPPRHAQRVAQALGRQVQQLVVPQAGHGLLGLACVRDEVFRFVDAKEPLRVTPPSCARSMPRASAFVPLGAYLQGTP